LVCRELTSCQTCSALSIISQSFYLRSSLSPSWSSSGPLFMTCRCTRWHRLRLDDILIISSTIPAILPFADRSSVTKKISCDIFGISAVKLLYFTKIDIDQMGALQLDLHHAYTKTGLVYRDDLVLSISPHVFQRIVRYF